MSKKRKNTQHTAAVNRKVKATGEMAKLGLRLEDDISILGFVFNHLSISHLTYMGLDSINKLCRTYAGIDVCLFTQHLIPSCLPPLCPVFSVSDLARWDDHPLIATSIGTTIEALASNASTVYHYAFDPEFIDRPEKKSDELRTAFTDPRVKVIVRHKSHAQLIKVEFGVEVCDTIVEDCDVETLAKLVFTEAQNG